MQSIPTVLLFDRFRKKSKKNKLPNTHDTSEKKKKEPEVKNEKVDVKKYITEASLIKEGEDYVLNGMITTDKYYPKLAVAFSCSYEERGVRYFMPVFVFKFENVNPNNPVNFFLKFIDVFSELKFLDFVFLDEYDDNITKDNFYTYHQIGSALYEFDEIFKTSATTQANNTSSGDNQAGFKYLDDLIHSGSKEVILDMDIVQSDIEKYDIGVTVDVDDITIDGKGHSIDARSLTPHFAILSKNVTLKNVVFLNGTSKAVAGSILVRNSDVVNIIDCTFDNCVSKDGGGAIFNNDASILIKDCIFKNNASTIGAAILNVKNLKIEGTVFDENHAENEAGAISNQKDGNVMISNSKFINNKSNLITGAVSNFGNMKIINTFFNKNHAKGQTGALIGYPDSNTEITKVEFRDNSADVDVGAVVIDHGILNISNSNFINNTANNNAGALSNVGGEVNINNVKFEGNHANNAGAVLMLQNGLLKMFKTQFINNFADSNGGASYLDGKSFMKTVLFDSNKSKHGGALFNYDEAKLEGVYFKNNVSDKEGAAIFNSQLALIQVVDSKFENNRSGVGKSIYGENPDGVIITNCDISEE